MIAYKRQSLDNLYIQEQAEMAKESDCITTEEYHAILSAYPSGLYTPNPYMRAGIFILTIVILLFSFGLFCLMGLAGREDFIGFLCFIFGVGSYAAAEYMVNEKKHYKSGADAALIWGCVIFLLSGLGIMTELRVGMKFWCGVTLILSVLLALRFADVSMSIVAHLSLLGFAFAVCVDIGTAGKLITPFVIMLLSASVYFLSVKLTTVCIYRHYKRCLQVLQVCALITLYLGGNYYVVRELSVVMFELKMNAGQDIAGGWFFWILTVVLPLLYILAGIMKKDRILLCVGLLLVGGIVYTIRYYYHMGAVEVLMTLGGLGMIAVAYVLVRYLKTPRHGFTEASLKERHAMEALQVESLVIAQTMSHPAGALPDQFEFGGGSGGGGGASGDF